MIQLVLGAWLLLAAAPEANASVVQEEVNSIVNKPEIELNDLFRLAELQNPALAAAKATEAAKAGAASQAGAYPNPVFTFEIGELDTDDLGIRKEKMTLEQTFPIGGRRGNAVNSARSNAEAASHDLAQTRREIYQRIHAQWANQLYFQETDAALTELLDHANQTLQIATIRFEARAAPESHATKALLEVYELETRLQRLTQQQVGAEADFRALMGGLPFPMNRLGGTLDQNHLNNFNNEVVGVHPTLDAASSRLEAAQADLSEARAERIPDLGVFASYGRIRPTGDSFVEAGISIPIPLFNRNQGLIAERSALLVQAQAQVLMVEANFTAKLAGERAHYLAIQSELQTLSERMLPAAQRGLDQTQEGYRVGKLPFLELIDAQRTLSNIWLRNLELRRDLVIAEVELLSLIGTGPSIHLEPTSQKGDTP